MDGLRRLWAVMKPNFSASFSSANSRCHVEDLLQSRQPLLLFFFFRWPRWSHLLLLLFPEETSHVQRHPQSRSDDRKPIVPLRHLLGANVSSASTSQLRLQNLFSRIVVDCILALLFVLTHPKKKNSSPWILLCVSVCVCVCVCLFFSLKIYAKPLWL